MIKLRNDHRALKAGIAFIVSKVGQGKASICSDDLVIEYPSEGLSLGQKFISDGRGNLLTKLNLKDVVVEAPSIITYKRKEVKRNNVLNRIA